MNSALRSLAIGVLAGAMAVVVLWLTSPRRVDLVPQVVLLDDLDRLIDPLQVESRATIHEVELKLASQPVTLSLSSVTAEVLADELTRALGMKVGLAPSLIGRSTTYTVHVTEVPAIDVLTFELWADQNYLLQWTIYDKNVLLVDVPTEDMGVLRIYDVRDILLSAARFSQEIASRGPSPTPPATQPRDGGPRSFYGGLFSGEADSIELEVATRLQGTFGDALGTKQFHGWVDTHYWGGRLFVKAIASDHARVRKILSELRSMERRP